MVFLKRHGLKRVAEQLSDELGLEEESDLQYVTKQRLERLDWLKDVPKEKLLKLCMRITADYMSPPGGDEGGETTLSQASTPPGLTKCSGSASDDAAGSDADLTPVVVVTRNVGDCDDFQEHMRGLLQDFCDYLETSEADAEWETFHVSLGSGPCVNWTLCMLLWVSFASEAALDQALRAGFDDICRRHPDQETMLSTVNDCLLHPDTGHRLWNRQQFEALGCHKPNAAAVYFTDCMVQGRLSTPHKQKWEDSILQDWFFSDEDVSEFLHRANRFLRDPQHSTDGMRIFERVVATSSYVAAMSMDGLAACIFFGYLEARRLDSLARESTAQGEDPTLHGFNSFVSSHGHLFILALADTPAKGGAVVEGLRCMALLGLAGWDGLGDARAVCELTSSRRHARPQPLVAKDQKPPPLGVSSGAASGAATVGASLSTSAVASAGASAHPSRQMSPRQLHSEEPAAGGKAPDVAGVVGADSVKGSAPGRMALGLGFGLFDLGLLTEKLEKLRAASAEDDEQVVDWRPQGGGGGTFGEGREHRHASWEWLDGADVRERCRPQGGGGGAFGEGGLPLLITGI